LWLTSPCREAPPNQAPHLTAAAFARYLGSTIYLPPRQVSY
jgi:hypothetical protein